VTEVGWFHTPPEYGSGSARRSSRVARRLAVPATMQP
jgi:hypothetical protein